MDMMKKQALTRYTDFLVKETETLLNIDSPTGYTEEAAAWVKAEFEKLGFAAQGTEGAVHALADDRVQGT